MTRWHILALVFFARIGLGFQFQTLTSVGDDLITAFGFDNAEIGLLIGLFMAPGLFLALPAGFLGRYASDRSLATFGLAALAVGGVITAYADNGWAIGSGRAAAGVGFLFTSLYFTKMIVDWFDGKEIATAMSVLVMSWPLGIAMGQVGHVWLAQIYDWRMPFQIASLYCGLAAIAVYSLYRPAHDLQPTKSRLSMKLTAREWRLILCAATAWGLFNSGYVAYLTFAPKMLISLGQPALVAASVVSIGSWLMIFSGTACGVIADRFGRQNTLLLVCMTAAVTSILLLSVPNAGIPASLLFGLVGMAPAGVIMALAGEAMQPERRAFGMGVFFTIYHAFMMATPPIAGSIFDLSGSPQAPLLFGVGLFVAVVPIAFAFSYFKSQSLGPEEQRAT